MIMYETGFARIVTRYEDSLYKQDTENRFEKTKNGGQIWRKTSGGLIYNGEKRNKS